jgi:Smg protein
MLDVLSFVFERFHQDDDFPTATQLLRVLSAEGYSAEETKKAIECMNLIARLSEASPDLPHDAHSIRFFSPYETTILPAEVRQLLRYLWSTQLLSHAHYEQAIDCLLAMAPYIEQSEAMTKLVILMIMWRQNAEVDLLLLNYLSDTFFEDDSMTQAALH